MMTTRSQARLVHAVRGRLRVRLFDGALLSSLDSLGAVRVAPGVLAAEVRAAARSVVVRYDPAQTSEDEVLAALAQAGVEVADESGETSPPSPLRGANIGFADIISGAERGSSSGSALREALIGPPPKLDRRFAESLALSAVSLVGARQIGLAFGGGMTLPAYFVIWLTLRRLTGAGRRR